jgi:hypothetical protein
MSIRIEPEEPVQVTEGGRTKAPSFPLPIIFGAAGVVLVVGLTILLWPKSAPARAAEPAIVPSIVQATVGPSAVPATATPSYADITPYRELIEDLIARGQYAVAITTAEGVLANPDVRETDRTVLIGYIVSAGMKDILSREFRPLDQQQHQQLVDTYLSLRERARTNGIELESPLEVAKRAHLSSQFPLARVAIEEALEDELFHPELDRDITRLYVSLLHGMGRWYTTADQHTPLYEEGLRALVTSDIIADHYRTGQSEAEALLEQLGYLDTTDWPEPLDTPLIP